MRAFWSVRPNCSHNVSQKVKHIRRFSEFPEKCSWRTFGYFLISFSVRGRGKGRKSPSKWRVGGFLTENRGGGGYPRRRRRRRREQVPRGCLQGGGGKFFFFGADLPTKCFKDAYYCHQNHYQINSLGILPGSVPVKNYRINCWGISIR